MNFVSKLLLIFLFFKSIYQLIKILISYLFYFEKKFHNNIYTFTQIFCEFYSDC